MYLFIWNWLARNIWIRDVFVAIHTPKTSALAWTYGLYSTLIHTPKTSALSWTNSLYSTLNGCWFMIGHLSWAYTRRIPALLVLGVNQGTSRIMVGPRLIYGWPRLMYGWFVSRWGSRARTRLGWRPWRACCQAYAPLTLRHPTFLATFPFTRCATKVLIWDLHFKL